MYETRIVPYIKEITRYGKYGKPSTACVSCNIESQVQVQKTVMVTR